VNLEAWLIDLGLEQYANAFAENGIDLSLLPELTNEDLKDLGVERLVDRKTILKAIARNIDSENDLAKEVPLPANATGERRQVTVLFADIAGYTKLSSELDAEKTHALLNRYFEAVDGIVERYGGSVDKHMGDNVMAVFGAPIAHDDDPLRAVRAVLDIHERMAALSDEAGHRLRAHIGIASGQVVASGTGSDSHREYTVTGDAVNLAARLEGLAGSGQTLVSEAVQQRTAGRFEATGLGPQTLKGIEQPVPVWRVEGEAKTAEHARGTPFVGRRSELSQCRAILAEVARTGQGQAILLRGAAGIGKTRLAEEVLGIAREAGFTLHRCLVLDFGSRKGQDAIPALVRSLLRLPPSSAKDKRVRAADGGFAAGAFAETERVFLNDLLDLPQPLELLRVYDAMGDATRRAGRRALVAGLAAWASRAGPQLIAIEDLHWADVQTLDNLAAVMATASEHPVALLATTRPEGDPLEGAWRAIGHDQPVSMINLGALRVSEAREMATGFARANQDRLAECLERAAGNPLFLEQLLQNAAESASDLVPGSIQSLVLARMDRLHPPDKRALQAASIFGQRFSLVALGHLLDAPNYDCAELLTHQLVRREGDDFLFSHALVRDGVYESILTAPRTRLHLKAAQWFEVSDPVLRAEHLHMAADPRAARAYLDAACVELAKYRYEQALTLLDKGRALATGPAERVELALILGEAQHNIGELEDARATFAEALDEAKDDAARCRAWLGLAGIKRITEDLDGALVDLDAAEAVARRLGLKAEEARAHHLRGNVLFPLGDTEGCLREHSTALAFAREAGSAELEAAALGGLADAEYLRGRYHSACERFTECVEVSRAHGLGRIEVANQSMIAVTAVWCGDTQHALDVALESIDAAQRVGHDRAALVAHDITFACYRALGKNVLARQHMDRAIVLARRLGARRFEAECLCFLGDLDFREGRRTEALENVRTALAIVRETGMAFMGPTILGGLMMITDDEAERRTASAEAEGLLAAGSISHNHVYFRLFAIDACLQTGEHDEAERHADALAAFCPEEGLSLIVFLAERGRALARAGRGERSGELATEIDRLIAEGERMLQTLQVVDLLRARAALLD
jgi:class 3 adenylate cyclase/tetratricopeptide (TPR) repeat protein